MAATDTPPTEKGKPPQLSPEQQMLNDMEALTRLLYKVADGPEITPTVGTGTTTSVTKEEEVPLFPLNNTKTPRPEPTREQRLELALLAEGSFEKNLQEASAKLEKLQKQKVEMNRNALTRSYYSDELYNIDGAIAVAKQSLEENQKALESTRKNIPYLKLLVENPHMVEEKKPDVVGEKNPDLTKKEVKPERERSPEEKLQTALFARTIGQKNVWEDAAKVEKLTKQLAKMDRNALTRYYYKDKKPDIDAQLKEAERQLKVSESSLKKTEDSIPSLQREVEERVRRGTQWHHPSVGEVVHGPKHEGSWSDQMKRKMRQAMDGLHEVTQKTHGTTPPCQEELEQLKTLANKIQKNQQTLQTEGTGQKDPGVLELSQSLDGLTKAVSELNPKGTGQQRGQKTGDLGTQETHVSTRTAAHLKDHSHHENGVPGPHVGQVAHLHPK